MRAHQSLLFAGALLCSAAIARAEETADGALKRGQAALKAGRVHDACDAFAASVKLEAKTETQLSLADCYEQDGKAVSAARVYRDAAAKDANPARAKGSLAKAAKLEAKAPKLRLAINPRPDGLVIKVDGIEVAASGDIPVDAGPHYVVVTAPGYEGHAQAPVDRERGIVDVIVRLEAVAAAPAEPATPAAPTPPGQPATKPAPSLAVTADRADRAEPSDAIRGPVDRPAAPRSRRKATGIILAGTGGAALVGAGVLFALSSSKFDDQSALCPDHRCASGDDAIRANALQKDARAMRGAGIGLAIGGGVLAAAGIYLIASHGKSETTVSLRGGGDGFGIALTRGF